jgi:hypothetical protein
MKKRHFLTIAATAATAAAAPRMGSAADSSAKAGGPALLTVTGAITKANRGAFDPVMDQMMAKQKLVFDKAHAFDFAALAAMPAVTIKPTLEYDKKPHELRGPLLATVLKAAGASASGKIAMRAIDGYAPTISMGDLAKYKFIVATHLDGKPMPLGGLGPLWAVYDADRFPDMAAKPVDQRFAMCPWGLYHVDVQA